MYSILIADEALEEIARLDKKTAGRVMMEISWLAENAVEITPRGLRGSLSAFAKLRVGDYRLIYEPQPHRREVKRALFWSSSRCL